MNATSIINELNYEYDLKKVLKIFYSFFEEEYINLSKNIKSLKEKYKSNLYGLNKPIEFYNNGKKNEGVIIDISSDGGIIIQVKNKQQKYYFGSISFS